MVLSHFNLREQPFGVTPDPRFLYASASHREALASILYGVQSGVGFVALTAKPGMGKTTLLLEALGRMRETTKTVFLFQTIYTPADLLRALLTDLGAKDVHGSPFELQSQLNELLVAQSLTGRRLVVAIDEAQNFDEPMLEAVRVLSNFETSRNKLIQIVLSGQPQLAEKLASPDLLQLRQRISIFGRLNPLSATETAAYIHHRLQVAGYDSNEPVFTNSALALIAQHSEGIPRNINNLCFNALSLAYALKRRRIDSDVVEEVITDFDLSQHESLQLASERSVSPVLHKVDARVFQPSWKDKLRIISLTAAGCVLALFVGWRIQNRSALTTDADAAVKQRQTPAAVIPSASSRAVAATVPEAGFPRDNASPSDANTALQQNSGQMATAVSKSSQVVTAKVSEAEDRPENGGALSANANATVQLDSRQGAAVPESGSTLKPRVAEGKAESRRQWVKVLRGQSLSGICAEVFGVCHPEMLREIIRINSSIIDPDHIRPGERVSIPLPMSASPAVRK
jgi:general secretion pathway protein A